MSKTIILADDNRTFLMYVGLLLKRFGFKVIIAENGLEVLKLIKLTSADLVILDVLMNTMDGLTVLRHLKADRRTSHIPVIMVSVDSSRETIGKCMENGSFDYLLKPIKINKLHDSLQMCFFGQSGTNRKCIRAFYNKKVIVKYQGEEYELYSESLSEGGIYLKKEDPLPVGAEVEIIIVKDRDSIRIKGEVIYVKQLFEDLLTLPPGMAVQFKEIKETDAKMIRNCIEDLIADDLFAAQKERVIER